jgi:hypothetical protein
MNTQTNTRVQIRSLFSPVFVKALLTVILANTSSTAASKRKKSQYLVAQALQRLDYGTDGRNSIAGWNGERIYSLHHGHPPCILTMRCLIKQEMTSWRGN